VQWLKQPVFCSPFWDWVSAVAGAGSPAQRLVVVDLVFEATGPTFLDRFRACLQHSYFAFSHHDESEGLEGV